MVHGKHYITFRQLGNFFDTATSTAWLVIGRVSSWLVSIRHLYVAWPKNEEMAVLNERFSKRKGIDHIIGAIDCTHIQIKAHCQNLRGIIFR